MIRSPQHPVRMITVRAIAVLTMGGCAESERQGSMTGLTPQVWTSEDSAAFLAGQNGTVGIQSHEGGVTIHAGESVVLTIISAECASVGSVLTVSGALSGTISTNACQGVGATLTLGAAAADGILEFVHNDPRFGPGSFQVAGAYPTFIVFMEDGFGDLDFNDSVIRVEILTACQMNVARLPQGDGEWADDPYDHVPGVTFAEKGCAVTAIAMALNFAGIQKTPGEVHDFMTDNDGFAKGNVVWDVPVHGLGSSLSLKFRWSDARLNLVELARQLCETNVPVIVGVKGTGSVFPGHFVMATGVENGRITIADPGYVGRTFLDDPTYGNVFSIRGSVVDPPGDISAFDVVVDDARLGVVDPVGRFTGSDAFSGGSGSGSEVGIPQSSHFVDAIDNDVTGEAATSSASSVNIFQPAEGEFQIFVSPTAPGPHVLRIHGFARDGSAQPIVSLPVNAAVGEVLSFTAAFSATPSGVSKSLFLQGSGATANPPTLALSTSAPAATTAKYQDSPAIKFAGGNPWIAVGTWTAAPTLVSGTLTTLDDARLWLGLKNSDDIGTRFDLRVELFKNGALVAAGETLCIEGVTRNPNLAKEAIVAFAPFAATAVNGTTDVLTFRVSTRIGTSGGAACGGHSNAVGLRLYFDAANRQSGFAATF